jgi:hypothetical protein
MDEVVHDQDIQITMSMENQTYVFDTLLVSIFDCHWSEL